MKDGNIVRVEGQDGAHIVMFAGSVETECISVQKVVASHRRAHQPSGTWYSNDMLTFVSESIETWIKENGGKMPQE